MSVNYRKCDKCKFFENGYCTKRKKPIIFNDFLCKYFENGMLEVQNEVLQRTVADLRARVKSLTEENETLKTNVAVLKCTVQRISGV